MVGENIMNFDLGINVVFCGLAIVFLMLIILIGVMCIFGIFSKSGKKEKSQKTEVVKQIEKPAQNNAALVVDGVDDETVAAITAAIYCLYNGSSVVPKITFIKPEKSRPAWARAGIAQNTRAF